MQVRAFSCSCPHFLNLSATGYMLGVQAYGQNAAGKGLLSRFHFSLKIGEDPRRNKSMKNSVFHP